MSLTNNHSTMKKLIIAEAFILFAGVAFGQTVQKGSILGVHSVTITPNPGFTLEQVIDFYVNKFYPAYEKEFPGLKVFLAKGIRGENEEGFGIIYIIESAEIRDKYWPEKDVSSELADAAFEKLQPLIDELGKMRTISGGHTDYLIF